MAEALEGAEGRIGPPGYEPRYIALKPIGKSGPP